MQTIPQKRKIPKKEKKRQEPQIKQARQPNKRFFNKHHPNPISQKNLANKIFRIIERQQRELCKSPLEEAALPLLNENETLEHGIQRLIKIPFKIWMHLHNEWNILFGARYVWDAIRLIESWSNTSLTILRRRAPITPKQRKAWNALFFPGATPKQAIEIIKRYWKPIYPPIEQMLLWDT